MIGAAERVGVLFGGGYSGGERMRMATHMNVGDAGVEKAVKVMEDIAVRFG